MRCFGHEVVLGEGVKVFNVEGMSHFTTCHSIVAYLRDTDTSQDPLLGPSHRASAFPLSLAFQADTGLRNHLHSRYNHGSTHSIRLYIPMVRSEPSQSSHFPVVDF